MGSFNNPGSSSSWYSFTVYSAFFSSKWPLSRSTSNLLQIILDRTETRGAWMKIHEYQLAKSVMLNVTIVIVNNIIIRNLFASIQSRFIEVKIVFEFLKIYTILFGFIN